MLEIDLTPEQETILRTQVFDEMHPGSVLHDFEVVLDYVGEKGIKSAGQYNMLPIDAIHVLDPLLARPLRLQLERPQLRSHPYLQGLHLLLRSTGLALVDGQGAKARLYIDSAVRASWNGLNATERYFTLLEAWFLVSSPEMIGENRGIGTSGYERWMWMLGNLSYGRGYSKLFNKIQSHFFENRHSRGILALGNLFGFFDLDQPKSPTKTWAPLNVRFTRFGDALSVLLNRWYDQDRDENEDEVEDEDEIPPLLGALQPWLKPYFPAYEKTLHSLADTKIIEGVYIFKVSLGEVWRRIALSSDRTLHTLVAAVLRAFKFDFDHLYSLEYRDELGRTVTVEHPRTPDAFPANRVELGMLPVKPGGTLSLLYDFGDSWSFTIDLERIEPTSAIKNYARLVEVHGKAPRQYR